MRQVASASRWQVAGRGRTRQEVAARTGQVQREWGSGSGEGREQVQVQVQVREREKERSDAPKQEVAPCGGGAKCQDVPPVCACACACAYVYLCKYGYMHVLLLCTCMYTKLAAVVLANKETWLHVSTCRHLCRAGLRLTGLPRHARAHADAEAGLDVQVLQRGPGIACLPRTMTTAMAMAMTGVRAALCADHDDGADCVYTRMMDGWTDRLEHMLHVRVRSQVHT